MREDVRILDAGPVRTLELDRPDTKNSLTPEVNRKLLAALAAAAEEPGVRCVVLTGIPGSFCSGLDLRMLSNVATDMAQVEADLRHLFHGLVLAIRALPKPVVAFVDGPAAGFGCDLALACDLRIATERARFCEVFVKRGLMPDGGATYTLPKLVGMGKALELMLLGDSIDGAEALRLGLVNQLVSSAELAERGAELTMRLAAAPPLVVAHIKRAAYEGQRGTFGEALDREAKGQLEILRSQDFAEGVSAFLEKRAPLFRGH